MSNTVDERYIEGYEKLREHMRETHAHAGDEVRIPSEKQESIRSLSEGYQNAIREHHERGEGPYKERNYSEGATEAVKVWESARIKEVIAPRESESETVRLKAW
jgi:hypothetical protein